MQRNRVGGEEHDTALFMSKSRERDPAEKIVTESSRSLIQMSTGGSSCSNYLLDITIYHQLFSMVENPISTSALI